MPDREVKAGMATDTTPVLQANGLSSAATTMKQSRRQAQSQSHSSLARNGSTDNGADPSAYSNWDMLTSATSSSAASSSTMSMDGHMDSLMSHPAVSPFSAASTPSSINSVFHSNNHSNNLPSPVTHSPSGKFMIQVRFQHLFNRLLNSLALDADTLNFVMLCLIWYASSALTNNIAKM
jgi:hypothetical protein